MTIYVVMKCDRWEGWTEVVGYGTNEEATTNWARDMSRAAHHNTVWRDEPFDESTDHRWTFICIPVDPLKDIA